MHTCFIHFQMESRHPVKCRCQNTCSRATKRNQCHCFKKWNILHIMCVDVTMAMCHVRINMVWIVAMICKFLNKLMMLTHLLIIIIMELMCLTC